MKVPKPGERMRSHPLYRVKTKPPVVFDDQRPGWDSTSRDLDKYKLTDEQVDVSATIHPRAANPNPPQPPSSNVFKFNRRPTHNLTTTHRNTPHTTPQARRKQFVSKNLAKAREELRAREDPTTLVVHPWDPPRKSPIHPAKSFGRIVDKANGGDGPRADESPSPPKVRGRNMAARGGGMGPVRFSPMKTPGGQHTRASLDRTFESHASLPNKQSPHKPAEPTRQTPLSHEAETSATARRLGEPPTQHNPRAEVPFAEARNPITGTQKKDGASRTVRATERARRLGFRPTRAPEAFSNPNGTGAPKGFKTKGDRGDKGGPTVPFEEEVERFRVSRLRRKIERVTGASIEDDESDEQEGYSSYSSGDDENVAAFFEGGPAHTTRIDVRDEDEDTDPFGNGIHGKDHEDPFEAVRDARARLQATSALRNLPAEPSRNIVGWSDGWMAGTSTEDVKARQSELMARQEAIKAQFGTQTEGSPGTNSDSSADAAPVSPEPQMNDGPASRAAAAAASMTPIASKEDAEEMARILHVPPMPTPRQFRPDLTGHPVPEPAVHYKPKEPEPSFTRWGAPQPTTVPTNFKSNEWMHKTANDTFQYPPPPPEERGLMTYAEMRDAQLAAFAEHAVRRSVEAAADPHSAATTPSKPGRVVLAEVGLGTRSGFPEPLKPSTTPKKLPFDEMYGEDVEGHMRRHVEDAALRLSMGDENFADLKAAQAAALRAQPGVGASSARFGPTVMPDALSALSRDGDVRRSFSHDERLQFGLRDEAAAQRRLEAMKTAAIKGVDANMAAVIPALRESLELEGKIPRGGAGTSGEFVSVPRDGTGKTGRGFGGGGFVRVGAPSTSSGAAPPAWSRVTDATRVNVHPGNYESSNRKPVVPMPWFAKAYPGRK